MATETTTMKKLFAMFMALMAIAMVSCEYDDSGILSEIESLKNRVQALEQLCAQSNTNIASLQALVEALQQRDYVKSVAPIAEGDKIIGYTITFAKGDPITIYHGKDGQDGQTPVVGVAKDEDGIYYWTLDGEWLTDDEGNNIPAIGGTPELKIKNDYWYVSYDGGDTWTKLGKATGETGATGATGAKGDSFFKSVKIYDDYVELILSNDSSIILPRDTAFEAEVEIIAAAANGGTVKLNQNVTVSKAIAIATGKSVVIDLNGYDLAAGTGTILNNGTLTIEGYGRVYGSVTRSANVAIVNKGKLILKGGAYQSEPVADDIATGYKAVKNGDWYYVVPENVDAVVINDADLNVALGNTAVDTIYMLDNTFTFEFANVNSSKRTLTVIGVGNATEVAFKDGGNSLGLSRFDNLTISNCNVKHMAVKSWGHMVFASSGNANGVYTISNCTFDGVGTQGIYINENVSGATYNILNCTFNGDFGGEGAVVIQNNANVKHIVNVTGCTFNNIPSTSCKVSYHYNKDENKVFTLNTDLKESDIVWNGH